MLWLSKQHQYCVPFKVLVKLSIDSNGPGVLLILFLLRTSFWLGFPISSDQCCYQIFLNESYSVHPNLQIYFHRAECSLIFLLIFSVPTMISLLHFFNLFLFFFKLTYLVFYLFYYLITFYISLLVLYFMCYKSLLYYLISFLCFIEFF